MKDGSLKVTGKVSHDKTDMVNVFTKVIIKTFLCSHSRHFMYPVCDPVRGENKSDQHILDKSVIFII